MIRFATVGILLIINTLYLTVSAQSFEGTMKFREENLTDTALYTYYFKGDRVRIEKYEKGLTLLSCSIADLSDQTLTILNLARKLYTYAPTAPDGLSSSGYKIIKSGIPKTIQGIKTQQVRVVNPQEDTEISYWVYDGLNISFNSLMRVTGRTEKIYQYFAHIPDNSNSFPLLLVERSLLRQERMQLLLVDIKAAKLESTLFEVPKDFRMFQ